MESSVMKSYDYGQRPGEVLILSKLPIQHQERKWVDGRICNMVDIPLDDVTLRLIALHSPRPLAEPARGYVNYWEKIISLLSEQPTPLVVVGDFNATQHSVVCKRLTSIGLRSAHEDRGRGYATTWPNGLWALPPIRIDQAFVSADVECLSIDEGTGTGSDHKPLIVDFRIHSPGRDETSRTAGR
jgi:endonuclease/exonuclease/phosphatase (EEP) superfamily protein YafD